jgi:hypothetical protein
VGDTVAAMTEMQTLARVRHELLVLGDWAFDRLRSRVEGLTDAEYLWEPAPGCWSLRPGPDGTHGFEWDPHHPEPQPLTTIAWRLSHVTDILAGDRNASWIGLTPRGLSAEERRAAGEAATAAAAIAALERAYARFRSHMSTMDSETLLEPMGDVAGQWGKDTRLAFVLHELDELIHHGAEIATLRDLYRALHA